MIFLIVYQAALSFVVWKCRSLPLVLSVGKTGYYMITCRQELCDLYLTWGRNSAPEVPLPTTGPTVCGAAGEGILITVPENQSSPESRMELHPCRHQPPVKLCIFCIVFYLKYIYYHKDKRRSTILWKYCHWGLACFSKLSYRSEGGGLIWIKTFILYIYIFCVCDLYLLRIELRSIPLTHKVEYLEGVFMGAARLFT